MLFEATYDGMYTDHKPVYAKAYASILSTDLHTNGEIKENRFISYTVGKVFKSLTQESCKETKRRITNQINAGNISKGYGYLRWNDDGGQLRAVKEGVRRYRNK